LHLDILCHGKKFVTAFGCKILIGTGTPRCPIFMQDLM